MADKAKILYAEVQFWLFYFVAFHLASELCFFNSLLSCVIYQTFSLLQSNLTGLCYLFNQIVQKLALSLPSASLLSSTAKYSTTLHHHCLLRQCLLLGFEKGIKRVYHHMGAFLKQKPSPLNPVIYAFGFTVFLTRNLLLYYCNNK